jgi:hypothetical protein
VRDAPNAYPRRFYLWRGEDATGISGEGHVADGIQWRDGSVMLNWLGGGLSFNFWPLHDPQWPDLSPIERIERIHGHNGKTIIVWRDDTNGLPFHDQTRCPHEEYVGRLQGEWPDLIQAEGSLARGIADVEAGRVKRLPKVTE